MELIVYSLKGFKKFSSVIGENLRLYNFTRSNYKFNLWHHIVRLVYTLYPEPQLELLF